MEISKNAHGLAKHIRLDIEHVTEIELVKSFIAGAMWAREHREKLGSCTCEDE